MATNTTGRDPEHQRRIERKAQRFLVAAEAHATQMQRLEGTTRLEALSELRDMLTDGDVGMWLAVSDIATALHYAAMQGRVANPQPVRFNTSRTACLRVLNDAVKAEEYVARTSGIRPNLVVVADQVDADLAAFDGLDEGQG